MFLFLFSVIMLNMLEKSLKMTAFDAHFHYSLAKIDKNYEINTKNDENVAGCTCAHSIEEWEKQIKLSADNKDIQNAFGIHPQVVGKTNINIEELYIFLEKLAEEKKISAIGEMGFDFFNDDFSAYKKEQEEYFNFQLELCQKYNLPAIIHCRKANEKLFEYSKELKKLPGVLFHSFMGSAVEAMSLKKRGINCFFSFGKQILNNNKKVISCVTLLPLNCLLCETDAPFQTLKGEEQTYLSEIKTVYNSFCNIRNEKPEILYSQLEKNYKNLFSLL